MKRTEVAAAVIFRTDAHGQNEFLLGQRGPGSFYPGYWEFPGGKVEPGETPRAALVRELHEELEIEVLEATPWIVREHVYEHAHVRLHFFRVTRWQGDLRDHVHSALAWQHPAAPTASPMLPANGPLFAALRLPAVCAITHAWQVGADVQLAALEAALAQGLRLVQLREAALPAQARLAFARAAVAMCRRHGAQVLVNGDAQLARAVDADGIHLPASYLKVALRAKGRPCRNGPPSRSWRHPATAAANSNRPPASPSISPCSARCRRRRRIPAGPASAGRISPH